MMKNFFGIMKTELLNLLHWNALVEFETELDNYMEYYNNDRIKLRLGDLTPVEYRMKQLTSN